MLSVSRRGFFDVFAVREGCGFDGMFAVQLQTTVAAVGKRETLPLCLKECGGKLAVLLAVVWGRAFPLHGEDFSTSVRCGQVEVSMECTRTVADYCGGRVQKSDAVFVPQAARWGLGRAVGRRSGRALSVSRRGFFGAYAVRVGCGFDGMCSTSIQATVAAGGKRERRCLCD